MAKIATGQTMMAGHLARRSPERPPPRALHKRPKLLSSSQSRTVLRSRSRSQRKSSPDGEHHPGARNPGVALGPRKVARVAEAGGRRAAGINHQKAKVKVEAKRRRTN